MHTKPNEYANECAALVLRQLQTSWNFKLPRVQQIRDYRRLYNGQVLPKLRTQFNVPVPVFSGMIDTLQADLNDTLIIKYSATDPADWKAVEKANAAISQEAASMTPGAKWDKKFRQYRHEQIMSGRGVLKYSAGRGDHGYYGNLEVVVFEDFFFEPMGGGDLDNHLFAGQQNIWRTASDLEKGVKDGIYDAAQVKLLIANGVDVKRSGLWDGDNDIGNRFRPLGLDPTGNDYVGERVFNMLEWVFEHKGRRWYMLLEPYSGIWVRFDKNSEVNSADLFPWMSSASHEDPKNFASKCFADDLYPVADSIITLFNQNLTNRQKRNLNAKLYDQKMIKDVQKLDEAQYRPDALVPVDVGAAGVKSIREGVFAFETPELTGTVELISWLQEDTGKNVGVTDLQQGAAQDASKKVGVAYTEMAQVSKRLKFTAAPFQEVGQQLGDRFIVSLKDHMTEPIAIERLGEHGVEWDLLKRLELHTRKPMRIRVTSKSVTESMNSIEEAGKREALTLTADSPDINPRVRAEMILRDVGHFSEHDIALLMDTSTHTNKETMAEASAAIQEILLRKKMPAVNYNADAFFMKRLYDFARNHQDTLPERQFTMLMEYMNMHTEIAAENAAKAAQAEAQELMRQQKMGLVPTPEPTPV